MITLQRVVPLATLRNLAKGEFVHIECEDGLGELVAMIFAQEPIEYWQAEIIDFGISKATGMA